MAQVALGISIVATLSALPPSSPLACPLRARWDQSTRDRDGGSTPLGWERESLGGGAPPARRTVKAFIYIHDVSEDQGCTSVVRGSHRLLDPVTPSTLYDLKAAGFKDGWAGSGLGRSEAEGFAPLGAMPNHLKFAAKAGDCCIFDLATYHTAQP